MEVYIEKDELQGSDTHAGVECSGGALLKAAYIPTGRGKHMLVLNGFSFTETMPTYWVCSRKKKMNCVATARTNRRREVVSTAHQHNHPRPRFYHKTAQRMIEL
ncbi:unnamed protein product [Chilo suppressalis]|uniref:FLYWCH-type domain-containing protein n=1 Tax=Chilo suppressalis TaxID=168631 RepID=A0ABN8B168_CHISP|nr:unnamed protein product [Chilo suppressalis]